MITKANLCDFDVRIKKVKFHSEENSMTVFDAVVMNWRPRKKEWVETKQIITCVGNFYGLVENDHFHITAEFIEDRRWGPQYQVYAYHRIQPGTELELKKFLTSIKGIGPKKAELLIDTFGLNVISQIEANPSCLNPLSMSQAARDNLYSAIVTNKSYEDLLLFLQLYGLSPKYATQIYNKYHDNAVSKIKDNPYALYLDEVIDFPAADKLNQSLGGGGKHGYRMMAGMLACIRNESESQGSVFVLASDLPQKLTTFLQQSLRDFDKSFQVTQKEADTVIDHLVTDGYLIVDRSIGTEPAVYLKANYYDEKEVADRLHVLLTEPKHFYSTLPNIKVAIWEQLMESHYPLSSEQTQAIETGLSSPISILTGGPGTGKSQTLAFLIKVIQRMAPDSDIRLCAPTGKAAVRLQELTNKSASTIHRLIGYPNNIFDENELVCDFVIIDEFSMCDIQLCSLLFRCISSGTRVIIVGDHEQLPSVGPGLVLRDLINSGRIPVTTLTKTFRQGKNSNHIVENAFAIIHSHVEDKTVCLNYSTAPGGDFYFIEAQEQSTILRFIKRSVTRLLAEGFPLSEIEVLSPIHASQIGTDNLNTVLQELLNHNPSGYLNGNNVELKVGDKVIQTKNDYELNVFNGETGTIKQIDYTAQRAVLVEFPGRDIWYDDEQVNDLELAYAITTHRSQGSEFQVVIIPIHESLALNLNRNLLYTAITRAKKRVVLIGSKPAFIEGLLREGLNERNSNLVQRLHHIA